jgi:hypothetical protein
VGWRERTFWVGSNLVRRNAESDLHVPANHPNFFDDQSQQLLALIEIQSIEAGHDALSEAADAPTKPIILDQILPLGSQLITFRGQALAALIHFARPSLQLRQLKEAGLIHVDQPAPLRFSCLEPSVEAA